MHGFFSEKPISQVYSIRLWAVLGFGLFEFSILAQFEFQLKIVGQSYIRLTLALIPHKKTSTISCRSSKQSLDLHRARRHRRRHPHHGDRHNSKSATKVILKEKKRTEAKVATSVACCYDCGAPLQNVELDAPGYVNPETYELKRRYHQLRTTLCGRCKLLSRGRMVTAVGGHGGYSGGKQFISTEELREKLSHLRHEKVLIVKLKEVGLSLTSPTGRQKETWVIGLQAVRQLLIKYEDP